jgi:hypothetical protein
MVSIFPCSDEKIYFLEEYLEFENTYPKIMVMVKNF